MGVRNLSTRGRNRTFASAAATSVKKGFLLFMLETSPDPLNMGPTYFPEAVVCIRRAFLTEVVLLAFADSQNLRSELKF